MEKLLKRILLVIGIIGILSSCNRNAGKQITEQLRFGQRYLVEENCKEAIVTYSKMIELALKYSETYITVAEAYIAPKNYDSTIVWSEQGYNITKDENIQQESIENAYEVIISEYIDACLVKSDEWLEDPDKFVALYPNVDPYILKEYHTPSHYDEWFGDEPYTIIYWYYDIDNNGTQELILGVAHHEVEPFAIYTFDGQKAVKIELGERTQYNGYSIFSTGIIAVWNSDTTCDYYKLDSDGCTARKIILSQEEKYILHRTPLALRENYKILADDVPCYDEDNRISPKYTAEIINTSSFPYTVNENVH